MLNVIIAADTGPEYLVRTLSSLIPAIAEGVLRDGWIVDPAGMEEIERIADEAGCAYRASKLDDVLIDAAGPGWILLIEAGVELEGGWWREVAGFIESAQGAGMAAAVFTIADGRYGLRARAREWLSSFLHYLPGFRSPQAAVIVGANFLQAGHVIRSMPVRLPVSSVRLRARAVVPR